MAGEGSEVVLLLHGHPESHLMWHGVAPKLAEDYTVVITDMRGYGESSKPEGLDDHSTYSKRVMAKDQGIVMEKLGYEKFHIAGHDRGGRVCHRMMIDYPDKIKSCTLLDIIPTIDVYNRTDQMIATKYWHWFFYIQPAPFPETFLGARPEYFIRSNILKKTIPGSLKADMFPEDIVQEYIRYYSDPKTVHAIAEDYRASVTIDWNHDMLDRENKMETPILCMWGSDGNISKIWDVVNIWENLANNVTGYAVEGCGHFVPEEKPEIVVEEMRKHIEKYK
ncbi:alpha/beta hydrolase [Maledivibacter halophilus]|uniref:alpha/beta hydrolase n=1 Tax=Maledivibacter halophilus TaxID=36842 RepID=UPI001AD8FB49|nr:alpha/beta hydrolase [Maledivibacter halophilus]